MPAKDLFNDKDKKFRLLFEDHPQPMCVFEPNTYRILEVNSAASSLYEFAVDEFRKMTLRDLESGDGGPKDAMARESSAPVSIWRHRTKRGSLSNWRRPCMPSNTVARPPIWLY